MNKLKEKTIENKLARYYSHNNYIVKKQVSLSQKRIDIIVLENNTKEVFAIEVKIYDWKTALRQANLNKIVCHKSFVAIWHKFSHRVIDKKDIFEGLGIGLIIIDESYTPRIEFNPKNCNFIAPLAHSYILNKL